MKLVIVLTAAVAVVASFTVEGRPLGWSPCTTFTGASHVDVVKTAHAAGDPKVLVLPCGMFTKTVRYG